MSEQMNVPDDLKDVLEMVQSGMVTLGGRYAVQLIERIGKLEAENARLSAPVRNAEWEESLCCTPEGYTTRAYIDALIAARKGAA